VPGGNTGRSPACTTWYITWGPLRPCEGREQAGGAGGSRDSKKALEVCWRWVHDCVQGHMHHMLHDLGLASSTTLSLTSHVRGRLTRSGYRLHR
jgi:hypothetical protein